VPRALALPDGQSRGFSFCSFGLRSGASLAVAAFNAADGFVTVARRDLRICRDRWVIAKIARIELIEVGISDAGCRVVPQCLNRNCDAAVFAPGSTTTVVPTVTRL
jgi:hypothetical protein